jgi:hypothetical protein
MCYVDALPCIVACRTLLSLVATLHPRCSA